MVSMSSGSEEAPNLRSQREEEKEEEGFDDGEGGHQLTASVDGDASKNGGDGSSSRHQHQAASAGAVGSGCAEIEGDEVKPAGKSPNAPQWLASDKDTTSRNQGSIGGGGGEGNGDEQIHGEKKMSKNQLRRKRKWERAMEVKERRKRQEREARAAKAKAEGRDLEEERRLEEQRRESGAGKKRRLEKWKSEKLPLVETSFQICVDCGYGEDLMTPKEINSLALQIRYCYGVNRKSAHPCMFVAAGLSEGGETSRHLHKVSGYTEWSNFAYKGTSQSLEEYYKDRLDDVVYLTSDSEHTLEDLDDSKVYVIGGIVDRNRLKRAAIDRAEKIAVRTARLPIDEHLSKTMAATRVLTCNHVFELLLKYRENGRNWKKALMDVLPHRKDAKFDDEGGGAATNEKAGSRSKNEKGDK